MKHHTTVALQYITYPHKKFSSNAKLQIAKENNFYIYLSDTWNAKMINQKIIQLMTNTESEEKSWKFIFCILLNPSFFFVYFYATSENYEIHYIDKNNKIYKNIN